MKNFKLFILLFLLLLCSISYSKTIGVHFSDTTVTKGTYLILPLYIDTAITTENISSFQFEINYNNYYLKYQQIITTNSLCSIYNVNITDNTFEDKFIIAGATATKILGKGILLYVKFKVLKSGGLYLNFNSNNSFFNEGSPQINLRYAYINIQEPPQISVYPNSMIISKWDIGQFGVYGAVAPVKWDLLDTTLGKINSDGLFTPKKQGCTKVLAIDSRSIADTMDNLLEVRPIKIVIRDTSSNPSQNIAIPISISDLSGLNVTSGNLVISFDSNIILPIDISTNNSLLKNYTKPTFSINQNKITIAFAGSSPISGSGILMYILFKIKSENITSYCNIEITDAIFNQDLLATINNCSFTRKSIPEIVLTPNSAEMFPNDTLSFHAVGGIKPYQFSVSDTNLARISANGLLLAKSGGMVKVKVVDALNMTTISNEIRIYDCKISIKDTSLVIGDTVYLPLYIDRFPKIPITAYEIKIVNTNPDIVPIGIETQNTYSSNWSILSNASNNVLNIVGASSSFTKNNTLLKLKLKLSQTLPTGQYYQIAFNSIILNEGKPIPLPVNGTIKTINIRPLSTPTNLSASNLSSKKVKLSWNFPDNYYLGFIIERKLTSSANYVLLDSVKNHILAYVDSTVSEGKEYKYRIKAFNMASQSAYSNEVIIFVPVGIESKNDIIPNEFYVYQNYPNPFNPSTIIKYSIPSKSFVKIAVFDVNGKLMDYLLNCENSPGIYEVFYEPKTLASGIYFYKISILNLEKQNSSQISKKMIFVK